MKISRARHDKHICLADLILPRSHQSDIRILWFSSTNFIEFREPPRARCDSIRSVFSQESLQRFHSRPSRSWNTFVAFINRINFRTECFSSLAAMRARNTASNREHLEAGTGCWNALRNRTEAHNSRSTAGFNWQQTGTCGFHALAWNDHDKSGNIFYDQPRWN